MRTAFLALALFSVSLRAEEPTAFVNATIHTAAPAGILRNGVLVVADGKITDIGPKETVTIPHRARVIDLKGMTVIPGLIDTHSHVGVWGKPNLPASADGGESSAPTQSALRALDSFDPNDPGIRMATAGGVTTANVMPGSGVVIGGQTVYVKFRGSSIEAMRIEGRTADGRRVVGGLKMANGENPKNTGRARNQAPFTRMKVAALQREEFLKARDYMAKLASDKKPDRDLSLEPLVEVLKRERTVHFHCHRADDILTAIRIAEEFDFDLVLQHVTEGYLVADMIAKKKVPVSLTLLDSPGGKAEVMATIEENAAFLDKSGVLVAINTDDSITESRFYLKTAALAVRGGMSEEAALRAITLAPAKMMQLSHRVGSLEKGKDADFVVLTGKPFSVTTKVRETWIDGHKVFDAENAEDRLYRDGGFLLPADKRPARLPDIQPSTPPTTALPRSDTLTTETTYLVRARKLHTAGPLGTIDDGAVLVESGRVKLIGKAGDFKVPVGTKTIYVEAVTPGLIDPFSCVGLSGARNIPADQDHDETSDPDQSDLHVFDGYNPNDPLVDFVRSQGVTTLQVVPGRANPIAGHGAIFRTAGRTVDEVKVRPVHSLLINLGETPKSGGRNPATRMGVAALLRKSFTEALTRRDKRKAGEKLSPAKADALLDALDGKIPVLFAAHRADDIRTALRLADEFHLKPVIALGTESYLLAEELAERKIPVLLHPSTQRAAASMETAHTLLASAALLHKAKVPFAMGTALEGYVPKTRNLRAEAAMTIPGGLTPDLALKAITLDAATLLGIDKDYGSLEAGKVADLVLYDGEPLEHTTHVLRTIMNGKTVFDREEILKLPLERRAFQGGFSPGAGCCMW